VWYARCLGLPVDSSVSVVRYQESRLTVMMNHSAGTAEMFLFDLHGLREHLDHPYRRLLDVLHEMHCVVAKLDLAVDELPDFTTVCTRKQDLEMRTWRVLLRLSAELHDTDMNRLAASQHYAKRTDYTFEAVKPRSSSTARSVRSSTYIAR